MQQQWNVNDGIEMHFWCSQKYLMHSGIFNLAGNICFYTDEDELQELVPFRTKSFTQVQGEFLQKMMAMIQAASPDFVMATPEQQKAHTKEIISRPSGVLQFVADNDEERIKVWFGSREKYEATPYLVLLAGHWCKECDSDEWKYGEIAEVNPFFAQVWTLLHKGEENYRVKMVVDSKAIEKLYE